MYNMQTRIDLASIGKTIRNALIPPESQITPRSGMTAVTNSIPKPAADQKAVTGVDEEKKPTVQIELSLQTPEREKEPGYPFDFTLKHLQDAIVWSEIIGKPVCKKRKRRQYGD